MTSRVISHYRIIEKLGAGGMGEVFLAEDVNLGRRVALKILPPQHTKDSARLQRFKQEAKAASGLNHPNILTIHEFGEADGQHFLVTEFIDGETLRQTLRNSGAIKIREALDVAIQAASALSSAHQAGIVHRDIKPENIMLRRDGYVKILDFGLAKLTETVATSDADSDALTRSAALQTKSGVVLGTAQYMSPEQATANEVDARSDIFSFGAVLYEMVSGQRAFPGNSMFEILAAIVHQEPRPLSGRVPHELASIILRCLRKDPARRYRSMADLKAALEDSRAGLTQSSRPVLVERPRLHWFVWPVVILSIAVATYFVWNSDRTNQQAPQMRAVALTTLPGMERSPSLSPDAKYVVFSWAGPKDENQDLYVQMIGSGSPLRLTEDPQEDYNPVWSPDGRWIAFLRSKPGAPTGIRTRELRIKPPLGGAEKKVADIRSQDFFPPALYLAWTPDSASLLVTDSQGEGKPDGLFLISVDTGEKHPLTAPKSPVLADTSPAVSPDGDSLAFLRRSTWGAGEMHLLRLAANNAATDEITRLTTIDLRADSPAWLPDSRQLVFSAKNALWRMDVFDDKSPARIPFIGEDGFTPTIAKSPDGKSIRLVYMRNFEDTNLWRIDRSSNPPVIALAPMSSTKHEYHCEFSPDGRRVVFTSGRSGDPEIWVADADGKNAVQLTDLKAQETMTARWSPDGQNIAFASNVAGEFDIYTIPASGGKPRRLTSHPAMDISQTFSRDGKYLYFGSMRSGDYRVWRMPASGGDENAVQISPNHGLLAFESFDRTHLYYFTASIVSPVWRLPVQGGEPVKFLDQVLWFNLCLSQDGAYYITRSGTETQLQYIEFATGKSSVVARNLGELSSGLTISPDGKTLFYIRSDSAVDDLMLVDNFQ